MTDNLILYEPVKLKNWLTCPYPGCNKSVKVPRRKQLERHIISHSENNETENEELELKPPNKMMMALEDWAENLLEKLVESEAEIIRCPVPDKRKVDLLYKPVEWDNELFCPYPGCKKTVGVSNRKQLEAHIRSHRKRKQTNFELSKTVTSPVQNDDTSDIMGDTSENITQSTDPGNEVIFPIDDEILESRQTKEIIQSVEKETADRNAEGAEKRVEFEHLDGDNKITCPYPGCSKTVNSSKRKALEAHIRSHQKRKRKTATENDQNPNEQSVSNQVESVLSETETIQYPVPDKMFDAGFHISNQLESNAEESELEQYIQKQSLESISINNGDGDTFENPNEHSVSQQVESILSEAETNQCPVFDKTFDADFHISNQMESNTGESEMKQYIQNRNGDKVALPVQNDEASDTICDTFENIIQSIDEDNEIVFPLDFESKPFIKMEETDTLSEEREHEDWFYIRNEDSIMPIFVCKLCHAEFEYLNQLHRHGFVCHSNLFIT